MARYSFRAYDHEGILRTGEIASATRDGALEALFRRGQHPIDITEDTPGTEVKWWQREVFGSGKLPLSSLAVFTRELASLVKAELPLDEALRIVAIQPLMPGRVRASTTSVLNRVLEGEALSDAVAAQPNEFPEFYWRLVRAGEASGSLGDVLDDLAAFLERSLEARAKVGSALLYPAVLVVAAVIALGVIMTVLLPTILPLFKDAGATPPLLIRVLASAEEAIASNWILVLVALGLAVLGIVAALNAEGPRAALDKALLRIPVLGRVIERRETGRLARTLATLIKNGVPILDAVRISASVLTNRSFRDAVVKAGEEVKEGSVLSAPLMRCGLFSDLFLRLTVVGEQTGHLDTMLLRAASIYEDALQRQIQRLTSLITPILTLAIGGVVGGLIITVMSAILSVNDLALK